jgi:hypothetical protein
MSEQAVQIISVPVGAVGTVNRGLFRVPTGYGGITLLNVWLDSDTAATIVSQLANMGTGLGTAVSSVIGTLTDGTFTANVRKPYTISTAYQAAGTWLGLNGITGTIGSASKLTVEFKWGK